MAYVCAPPVCLASRKTEALQSRKTEASPVKTVALASVIAIPSVRFVR